MSDNRIHRVEGKVMLVNSHLVEGAEGIVVVDGMLTVTDARAVRRRIDDIGKPVLGAIVTHAHPDHYAGFAELLRGLEVPVAATAGVRDAIARDDATKDAIVGPMMGDEWPKARIFPNQIVETGSEVRFGELVFEVHDVGRAESPADTVWKLDDRTLFVGDLVYAGMHAYLADGHAAEWIACLDALERTLARNATLHVGHGPAGGMALLDAQRRYVQAFVRAVEHNLRAPEGERRSAVAAEMRRFLATEDLAFLMELSVDPFAAKLVASRETP